MSLYGYCFSLHAISLKQCLVKRGQVRALQDREGSLDKASGELRLLKNSTVRPEPEPGR